MLRHGMDGVIADIRHRNAALAASRDIDTVISGCGNCHHFQPGQLRKRFITQLHFVDDRYGGMAQARH